MSLAVPQLVRPPGSYGECHTQSCRQVALVTLSRSQHREKKTMKMRRRFVRRRGGRGEWEKRAKRETVGAGVIQIQMNYIHV